jgi:hypothetical protein
MNWNFLSKNAPANNQTVWRWQRTAGEIARRLEVPANQTGTFVVEPGTNAFILRSGQTQGPLPPGEYSVAEKFASATLLLADTAPFDLTLTCAAITRDNARVNWHLLLQLQIDYDGLMNALVTLLKGQSRLTTFDVAEYLLPQAQALLETWSLQFSVAELAEQPQRRSELEAHLQSEFQRTLQQAGVVFQQLRSVRCQVPLYGQHQQRVQDYDLLVSQAQDHFEGYQRLADVAQRSELAYLEAENRKAELAEKKLALYARAQAAVQQQKFFELTSARELELFIAKLDHERVLEQREKQQLLTLWQESQQDQALQRQHLLRLLALEQTQQIEARKVAYQQAAELASLRHTYALNQEQLQNEIRLATQRHTFEWEQQRNWQKQQQELQLQAEHHQLELARVQVSIEQIEVAKAQAIAEAKRVQWQSDFEAGKAGVDLLIYLKEGKARLRAIEAEYELQLREQRNKQERLHREELLRMERLDKLERDAQDFRQEMERTRYQAQQRAAEFSHLQEMQRIQAQNALQRRQIDSNMSPEQLLAANTSASNDAAQVLINKYQAQDSQTAQATIASVRAEQRADLQAAQAQAAQHAQKEADRLDRLVDSVANRIQPNPTTIPPTTPPAHNNTVVVNINQALKCQACQHPLAKPSLFCPECGSRQ